MSEFNLQSVREEKNMTRAVLAEKTGLSAGYIKVIERKGAKPSVEVCNKIAMALGLPLETVVAKYRPKFLGQLTPAMKTAAKTAAKSVATKAVPAHPSNGKSKPAKAKQEIVDVEDLKNELLEACYGTQKAAELGLLAVFEVRRNEHRGALQSLLEFQAKLNEQVTTVSRILVSFTRAIP